MLIFNNGYLGEGEQYG